MNCHFCGRDCGDSRFGRGVPVCRFACDERRVAFDLAVEEARGVTCSRVYIISRRTGLTTEQVTIALTVLKARGLVVEVEEIEQVWGWKLTKMRGE